MNIVFIITLILRILVFVQCDTENVLNVKERKEKATKLPPCKACTTLVQSFKLGLERTSRGKHGGGDAAWEEEKLRSYKKSEVRLVEIQERLCHEIKRGQDQCHNMANDNEHLLEEWFITIQQDELPQEKQHTSNNNNNYNNTNNNNNNTDLFEWLCIEKLEVCCPTGHYGPSCKPCINCHQNGKCKGDGTRKGNGKCLCDSGYTGDECETCAKNYYESFRDANKLLCSACHKACTKEEGCNAAGPKGCIKCNEGWRLDVEHGCVDINECIHTLRACRHNQFCVNNEGSYTCLECDRACNGCDGDGPDMCKKCADGYILKDGKCEDTTSEQRDRYVNITRFLTYLGLCVATCVIFQSSTHIAYIVGAAVAIYIATSEYWLNSTVQSSANKPEIDTKKLEEIIKNSL